MKKSEKFTVALIYDFDGTLSPGNMQEYDFIPAVGRKNEEFWEDSTRMAQDQDGDTILAYLWKMIHEARHNGISLKRASFIQSGKKIGLYEGVKEWFSRINRYAARKEIRIEHYIISSGIREMIEGTPIAKEFKKIYACSFFYDVDDVAYWPSAVVNYTTKTQFLFKINKGIDSVTDDKRINDFIPEDQRPVPFRHMIYVGDGTTDIPCMKLVKEKGGCSIAVYDPATEKYTAGMQKLIADDRVNFVCRADYSPDSEIDTIIRTVIDKIDAEYKLSELNRHELCSSDLDSLS